MSVSKIASGSSSLKEVGKSDLGLRINSDPNLEMTGKMKTVLVAIRPTIARLALSLATKRNPSLMPLWRFSSSSAVPLTRAGSDHKEMMSATNENAFRKNAEAAPYALISTPPAAGPTRRDP